MNRLNRYHKLKKKKLYNPRKREILSRFVEKREELLRRQHEYVLRRIKNKVSDIYNVDEFYKLIPHSVRHIETDNIILVKDLDLELYHKC